MPNRNPLGLLGGDFDVSALILRAGLGDSCGDALAGDFDFLPEPFRRMLPSAASGFDWPIPAFIMIWLCT